MHSDSGNLLQLLAIIVVSDKMSKTDLLITELMLSKTPKSLVSLGILMVGAFAAAQLLVIHKASSAAKTQTAPQKNEAPQQANLMLAQTPPDNSQPSAPAPAPASATASMPAPAPKQTQFELLPVSIKIPSINLVAPVVKTGLEASGALHVPSSPDLTGWYDLGPKPGEIGPSVITGHLDSAAGPGVFWNLNKTRIGDEIDVVRDDGSIAVFKIYKEEKYPQNNFETQKVYGAVSDAELRVITCAGTYSKATGHYSDDLVVYANLEKIQEPGAYQPL